MLVLGIESSCDETGVALVRSGGTPIPRLLSHALHSQIDMHRAYGGVVPELASRDHVRRVVPLTRQVLGRAFEIYAEKFAEPDGRVPATFEILTLTGWTPDASQQKPLKPGSAKMRLADALGVVEQPLPRDED